MGSPASRGRPLAGSHRPVPVRTGSAADRTPGASSSSASAHPRARTCWSSSSRARGRPDVARQPRPARLRKGLRQLIRGQRGTNNALTPEQRNEALRTVVEHAAGGRLAVRHDVQTLSDVATVWRRAVDGATTARVVLAP